VLIQFPSANFHGLKLLSLPSGAIPPLPNGDRVCNRLYLLTDDTLFEYGLRDWAQIPTGES